MIADVSEILDAVATRLAAIPPKLGAATVPVVKRKLLKHQPDVDPGTFLTVYKSPVPEVVRRVGGKWQEHTVRVRIGLLAPGNDDQATSIGAHAALRLDIQKAFEQKPADLMGLDNLRDCSCAPAEFFPVAEGAENYDLQALDVAVTVMRERAPPSVAREAPNVAVNG